MDKITVQPSCLKGCIRVPSSKSVAHRGLIAGALREENLTLTGVDHSKDIEATLLAINQLGGKAIWQDGKIILMKSPLTRGGTLNIDANESGSTLRFLIPLAPALENTIVFSGQGRLPMRPLDPYFNLFQQKGVSYTLPEEGYLPLKVSGTFSDYHFEITGDVSSQFITGLMFAGIAKEGETTIHITTKLESRPYVELTAKVLREFAHQVTVADNQIHMKTGTCQRKEYHVERDWSQAAFFLCAGALKGEITLEGMNPNSGQGDKAIVSILKQFGAELFGDENITVKTSSLKACDIDAADIPDLIPVLSVLACGAVGTTTIYNAGRLRLKESDRLTAMYQELSKLGANIKMGEETLTITGGVPLNGGRVSAHNDHRIVMAMAVASLLAKEPIVIDGASAIEKSYPGFFKDFKSLGGWIHE